MVGASGTQTRLKKFVSTDLGALAFSRALVGLVAWGMENECHRSYFHPDWLPTERAMFESLFWGPILAVLQFPVFWWSRKPLFWPKIGPITTDLDGTRGDRIPPMPPTRRYGSRGPGGPKQPKFRKNIVLSNPCIASVAADLVSVALLFRRGAPLFVCGHSPRPLTQPKKHPWFPPGNQHW